MISRMISFSLALFALFTLASCGPKAFTKGDYDENVEKENTLNDQWSETDMQKAVHDLVGNLVGHRAIAAAPRPPVIMVTKLENKYAEFDGLNLTWECLEGIAKHNGPLTQDIPEAIKQYNN